MYEKAMFVPELPRNNGTNAHGRTTGRLVKNLRGGKSADPYYIEALLKLLKKHVFYQSDIDRCLVSRFTSQGIKIIAITVDEFLVVARKLEFTEQFSRLPKTKYNIEQLGRPT